MRNLQIRLEKKQKPLYNEREFYQKLFGGIL